MPNFNQTGPEGRGPTGRRLGICGRGSRSESGEMPASAPDRGDGFKDRFNSGRRCRRGNGGGRGQGRGRQGNQ